MPARCLGTVLSPCLGLGAIPCHLLSHAHSPLSHPDMLPSRVREALILSKSLGHILIESSAKGRVGSVRVLIKLLPSLNDPTVDSALTASAAAGQARDPPTLALEAAILQGHFHIAQQLLQVGAPVDITLLQARKRFLDETMSTRLLDSYPSNLRDVTQGSIDELLGQAASDAAAKVWGITSGGGLSSSEASGPSWEG